MRSLFLLILALLTACPSKQEGPRKYLGESPSRLEAGLHVSLSDWSPWVKDSPYESACDLASNVTFFGQSWTVCAIRKRDRIVGIDLLRRGLNAEQRQVLKRQVAHVYGIEETVEPDLYSVGANGSVIRLRQNREGETRLTVTDGEFGRVYAAQVLKEGLGDVERALTPH
jgi:hypothetical protein